MYNMGYKPLTVPGTHTHISHLSLSKGQVLHHLLEGFPQEVDCCCSDRF